MNTNLTDDDPGFSIDPPTEQPRILTWRAGGCRPATPEECLMWDALAQAPTPRVWATGSPLHDAIYAQPASGDMRNSSVEGERGKVTAEERKSAKEIVAGLAAICEISDTSQLVDHAFDELDRLRASTPSSTQAHSKSEYKRRVAMGDPAVLSSSTQGTAPDAASPVDDPVFGHKTFISPTGEYSHEPLKQSEADAIMARVEEHRQRVLALMPDEPAARRMLADAVTRMKEFGWREIREHKPAEDGPAFEVFELGSSGAHAAAWMFDKYWIPDHGDLYPSRPILFRAALSASRSSASTKAEDTP